MITAPISIALSAVQSRRNSVRRLHSPDFLRPPQKAEMRGRVLRSLFPTLFLAIALHSLVLITVFSRSVPDMSMAAAVILSLVAACLLIVRASHLATTQLERAVRESEERFSVLVEHRDMTERKKAEEALREKTAFVQMLQEISSAANESKTVEEAMQIGLDQVCRETGWPLGHALLVSPVTGMLESIAWYTEHQPPFQTFQKEASRRHILPSEGLAWRAMTGGAPAWVRNITHDPHFTCQRAADLAGLKGAYAFPVKVGNEVVAVLEFFSTETVEPDSSLLDIMAHVGTQLGRVVERARADAALRESEMRFRSVAQSANDAIVSCNSYGFIIAWNKGAKVIFGYDEEEILGMSLSLIVPTALQILSPDNQELLLSGPRSMIGRTLESIGKSKSGQEIPIELSIADWKVGEDVFFTAIIRNILKRKEAEAHLDASLKEKEVLLKEIHHRVKNNLQIISSLLRLQSQHVTDSRTLDMFRESQNRVQSMALIHEYLYQSHDLASINFSNYLRNLISHLFRSYGVTASLVTLMIDVDECPLDLDMAIPCGLIVTELVSNSLKYAFPDSRAGIISISFHAFESGRFELSVKDNGIGIPVSADADPQSSLGLRLVHTLTRQLSGDVRVDRTQGTAFTMTFRSAQK